MSVPQVLGPYQLKARLAAGGQGEVWLAYRRGPGGFRRRCAVKCLGPPTSHEDAARKAFIAEARLMAHFDHQNLVAVTDLGWDKDARVVYTVMPYISGTTLASIIRDVDVDRLEIQESLWIMSRVFLALHFAHNLRDERGRNLNVIHRDVSPENVLIGFDGQVRLIDFGIALSAINPRTTRVHVVKGKLDFLSPEQANADQQIDRTTDIYSGGLLLYTLLTGENPLEGDPDSALDRARDPDIPQLASRIDCPQSLDRLVHQMLSLAPEDRPQASKDVARALLSVIHEFDPTYDELAFTDALHERLADDIEVERDFLKNLGEGTQIIDTSGEDDEPSEVERKKKRRKGRRHATAPVLDQSELAKVRKNTPVAEVSSPEAPRRNAKPKKKPQEKAEPGPDDSDERRRRTGQEHTRDDLADILAELEEIYDD